MALQAQARRSMPRGVPMAWMDDLYEHPPVWVARGGGRELHRRRRPHLPRHVRGRHERLLRPRAGAGRRGRRPAGCSLGNQFLLPGEDAIAVAEHLAGRYGLPKWQFTLSATQANTEVIRLARELTGREIVLMFDAKYHGEGDATLVIEQDGELVPESRGLPAGIAAQARIVQFNDVAALEAALAPGDVALVLAEPAMTNAGFILPEPGFHEVLRRATRDAGTLLALDETHTLVCAYGGLGRRLGARARLPHARQVDRRGRPARDLRHARRDRLPDRAARGVAHRVGSVRGRGRHRRHAVRERCCRWRPGAPPSSTSSPRRRSSTPPRSARRWPTGCGAAIGTAGLRWSVAQYGGHASYFFAPTPPTDGAGSRAADDPGLRALVRVFMANRGVWESGWWLGPPSRSPMTPRT